MTILNLNKVNSLILYIKDFGLFKATENQMHRWMCLCYFIDLFFFSLYLIFSVRRLSDEMFGFGMSSAALCFK